MGLIAVPAVARMSGQLSAANEARRFALALVAARDEAIRLRTVVRITPTSTGFTIDINADDLIEQTVIFQTATVWDQSVGSAITFNGLGLARGIYAAETFALRSNGATTSVTVNSNGTVSL